MKSRGLTFGSTYLASVKGVSKEGRKILRPFIREKNGVFPRANDGNLRISVDADSDHAIERIFMVAGLKKAFKVDYHCLPKKLLDEALTGKGSKKPVEINFSA